MSPTNESRFKTPGVVGVGVGEGVGVGLGVGVGTAGMVETVT
jgi:hypothetical protein